MLCFVIPLLNTKWNENYGQFCQVFYGFSSLKKYLPR